MSKKPTIDDLLNALRNPSKPEKGSLAKLSNTADTWSRIGNRDSFAELGLEPTELESFLKEWVKENPYNNI